MLSNLNICFIIIFSCYQYASAFHAFVKNFKRPLHNPARLHLFELEFPHEIENNVILLLTKFDYNYKDLDMRV